MDFDLYVIGGGSGGVRASRMAAGLGAKVGLAESGRMGGTCVNVGCVPKKLFSYASHFHEDFEDAVGFGWDAAKPGFDWPTLIANKDEEITRLNGIYERILMRAGVEIHRGRAVVTGPNEVTVGDRVFTAERILVATGSKPWVPAFPGHEHALISDDLFELDALPHRIAIVGGGYIACEFASIFNALGCLVHVVVRSEVLRGFDDDVQRHVHTEMEKKGVRFHLRTGFSGIRKVDDHLELHLDECDLELDAVVFATGRKPNTEGLGLEEVGVKLGPNGKVLVDDDYRTSVPSIYAVGDVIDRVQLTPVALAEGMYVAHQLYGGGGRPIEYRNIATAVFTSPNVATVGLTEAEARRELGEVRLYKSTFRPMKHTLSGRDEKTFMKLVVDDASDRVVGCHMVGPDAGELIQGLAVAITCGATKEQFDATIGIHPTAAEEFVTMRTAWGAS